MAKEDDTSSHGHTSRRSRSWGISPSAPPISHLQPVLLDLEEELKDWKPHLTEDDRQSIKKEIERLVDLYLKE